LFFTGTNLGSLPVAMAQVDYTGYNFNNSWNVGALEYMKCKNTAGDFTRLCWVRELQQVFHKGVICRGVS
jgi:hypothetical protein